MQSAHLAVSRNLSYFKDPPLVDGMTKQEFIGDRAVRAYETMKEQYDKYIEEPRNTWIDPKYYDMFLNGYNKYNCINFHKIRLLDKWIKKAQELFMRTYETSRENNAAFKDAEAQHLASNAYEDMKRNGYYPIY